MTLLLIAKTLSLADGQGRYARELINQLKDSYRLVVLTSDRADFRGEDKIKIYKLPSYHALGRLWLNAVYGCWLIRYLWKVDKIHFLSDYPYCLLLNFIPTKKSIFITVHGTYGVKPLENKISGWFLRKAYQKSRKIICVSNFTREEIIKRVKLDNLIVINNGVNYEKWQKDNINFFSEGKPIIVGVGALKTRKGYHISLAAMALIKEKYPDFKYYIVGDQSDTRYFQKLRDIIKTSGLEKNIIFCENISDEKLLELYYQANLFLLTPINVNNNFEGFGFVYLEAGACGKPVIGSSGCGAEDAIKDGISGYLVEQNNLNEIAKTVLRILSDQLLAKKLGNGGRVLAQEKDWSKVGQQYKEIYNLF